MAISTLKTEIKRGTFYLNNEISAMCVVSNNSNSLVMLNGYYLSDTAAAVISIS